MMGSHLVSFMGWGAVRCSPATGTENGTDVRLHRPGFVWREKLCLHLQSRLTWPAPSFLLSPPPPPPPPGRPPPALRGQTRMCCRPWPLFAGRGSTEGRVDCLGFGTAAKAAPGCEGQACVWRTGHGQHRSALTPCVCVCV